MIVHIVLSGELAETKRRQSFVHEAVDSDFQDLSAAKVYAAGPPPMIDALRDVVIAKGVSEDNIHSDPFTPAVNNDVSVQKGKYGGFLSRLLGWLELFEENRANGTVTIKREFVKSISL